MQYDKQALKQVLDSEQKRIESTPVFVPSRTITLVRRLRAWLDTTSTTIEIPEEVVTALFLAE